MSSGLYIQQKTDYHFGRWIIILVALLVVSTGGWFGYQWFITGVKPPVVPLPAAVLADPTVDETKITPAQIDEYSVPATHPRYISIPALGVIKARVQNVGLTKNNTLDTPKNISDTAWYNKSAIPGAGYGSVLIDGHNGGISRDGVFANLNTLKNSDEITIERGDGKKITYAVTENRTESLQDANTTGMKRLMTPFSSGQEGLGLITCAGNWIPRDKVFDKRVLVRAVIKS